MLMRTTAGLDQARTLRVDDPAVLAVEKCFEDLAWIGLLNLRNPRSGVLLQFSPTDGAAFPELKNKLLFRVLLHHPGKWFW
ncbi:MAG: hypothetical protein FJ271_31630 [Planctomycetes bacterium]|nr:hypothetical protein [Planctomycetota bacterium]